MLSQHKFSFKINLFGGKHPQNLILQDQEVLNERSK
jgi:hypothetical protein